MEIVRKRVLENTKKSASQDDNDEGMVVIKQSASQAQSK